MGFHEVRFPANLSFGSIGGPERRTEIVTLTNGFEERNTPWEHSRRRYDAGVSMRSLDDVEDLISFFEARQGQMYGFRWKDWADYKSGRATVPTDFHDQVVAKGDGVRTEFQLIKTYSSGTASYTRLITKPVAGTVTIGLRGDQQQEGIHFEVSTQTGVVTFNVAPAVDEQITAGYEFDVPVRFDIDRIHASVASFHAGDVPSVPVVEVRV